MKAARLVLALVMALAMLYSPAANAASTVYRVPRRIDATGSRDVTSRLNRFLARVPDGSTIVFRADGRYRVEGTLYLKDRRDLTIDGNGARFFARTDGATASPAPAPLDRLWPRHRVHWYFYGGGGIVLRDLVIDGANRDAGAHNGAYVPSLEAQHGVEFAHVDGATLHDCKITDTYGDLVSVTRQSNAVVVRDCHLERSGRQGITVDDGTNVVIKRNYLAETGRSAIDLEPATDRWAVRGVRIARNTIGAANGVFVAAYGRGSNVEDIDIVANNLVDEPLMVLVSAPEGHRRRGFRVIDNVSARRYGGPQAPLRFTRVDGVEIRGNYQEIAPERFSEGRLVHAGISVGLHETCDVTIESNVFPGADRGTVSDNWPCE